MDNSQYKPRRKWPLVLFALLSLLVVLYFAVTSTAFLRAVVLPRVAASLHSDLTVEDISLSPFSALTLRQLKLTPHGAEPLATVQEVRLRYSLLAILGGTMKLSEVSVDSPTITVVGHPDGTSNLSQLLDALAKGKGPAAPAAPGKPARLDIHNVVLKDGTLRQTTVSPGGPSTFEITGLNVTLDQLVNGAPSRLTLTSLASLTAQATNHLAMKTDGAFTVNLDPQLQPVRINGTLDLGVTSAGGAFREFGKVAMKLSADADAAEIKELRLAITESGRPVGELKASGPFDLEKKETRLDYELKGIDRTALGIVGAMAGVDFGQTTIAAAGRVDLAQHGQIFASHGKLAVNRLSLKSTAGTTPVLDTSLDYRLQVNLVEKTVLVEQADLTVQQGGARVIQGALDRPMNISWDVAAPGFREATYSLSMKQFDLAPWRSMGGTNLPAGKVTLAAGVTSDRDGRRLKFNVDLTLEQVEATVAGRLIRDLGVTLKALGSLEDFKVLTVEQGSVEARHAGKPLAQGNGFATFNQRTSEVGAQTSIEVQLPVALAMYPVEGIELSSGVAKFNAQLNIKSGQTNGTAGLGLSGLTGRAFGAALRDYQAQFDSATTLTADHLILRRGSLGLRAGADSGGSLDVTGDFDLRARRGAFDFKTVNLNEKAIGPFFAAAIAPNELRSVSLDLNGSAKVDLQGESSLNSTLKVTRLVARDPAGTLPAEALAFGVDLEATQRAQTVALKNLMVDLGATPRAANRLRGEGRLDFATNKAAPGTLNLTSDGLDFTTLYNLFAGHTNASPTKPKEPAAAGKAGQPVQLPFEQFTLDAKIAAIFLREIAASNVVARVGINHGKISVNPFSLTLNGAPVGAGMELDLGVPGYRYDLTADLQSVPVPPLAKSLLSGQLVDLKGTVSGKMKLQGAGTEGADLRQHLAGNVEFAATNLDYQITALQTPLMKGLVNALTLALQLPAISQSPIQGIAAHFEAGQGTVNLKSARVSSAAFAAEAQGKVQLADILTNSTINIPVTVSLPQEGKMEALPQFLTMRGTVGVPKPEINALALAQAATRLPGTAGSLVNKGVGQLGGALDKVLGGKGSTNPGAGTSLIQSLLGGGASTNTTGATNKTAATNAAVSTNAPAKPFNPLDLFKKPEKK